MSGGSYLLAFILCLGFSMDLVKAASCPAPGIQINATEVCGNITSNETGESSAFTRLVCDSLHNLSTWNSSFISEAFDFLLRKDIDLQLNVLKFFVSKVNRKELEDALEEFNEKVFNSSLIPTKWKGFALEALWDGKLRNEKLYSETEFVEPWFQKRLRPFLSVISTDMLQCLQNETLGCAQYQAIVKGLDLEFKKMSHDTQEEVYGAFQLRYLKGFNSTGSTLRCYTANTSLVVYLRETFQSFAAFLNLRDLASIIPASAIPKIVNTIPPAALADLLSSSEFLNDNNLLTILLKHYKRKGAFLDLFNKKSIVDTLSNDTRTAILAGVWPAVLRSNNETEVDMWLSARLLPYLRFFPGSILNFSGAHNASCTAFRKIVGKLSNNMTALKVSEQEIYNFTKAYLTATRPRPRCYSATDPRTANWLAVYLGPSIRHSSADDIRSFVNGNATILQDLAVNTDNLRLINHTRIHRDVAELYATALFSKNSNFSLANLPDQLLCFARHSTAIRLLSSNASLNIIAKINLLCGPSTSDRQLATMLVAQVTTFDARTLAALGQQAVGLTAGQILELKAQDIADPQALQSLGQVNGWDRGQSQGLMNKLISNNFMFDTAEVFQRLGTLVPGLPSHVFNNITADAAMKLANNASFHRAIRSAPDYLKRAFVDKMTSNSSLSDILNNVSDDLVDQVPIPLLAFRNVPLDLRKINKKQWSAEQAAVFFVGVLNATDNYTDLSASVLQGFQCSVASRLSPGKISSLVEQVKTKNAVLSASQLSCMAKLLAKNNMTTNFSSYPPDVLLFFDFTQVHNHTCKEFYSLAAQGNLNLLPNGSAQRTQLLNNALVCLEGVNHTLSEEQLHSLSALVCDMDPAAITNSDPEILENLKLCPDLAGAQKAALNGLLSHGETPYRVPASWDLGSLQRLGSLTLYLNQTTWRSINEGVRKAFVRSIVAGYQTQSASQKEKTMLLLKSIGSTSPSSSRSKRATEQCRSAAITASTIQDPLFIVHYDTKGQFDACLSNEVLKANLVPLLAHPLPEEYLDVMKRKLSEVYPAGVPEDQLKLFGQLSRRYDGNEISKWSVTSSDTLSALLDPSGGSWKASGAQQLITRYTELGGTLSGPLLQKIGGRDLCDLKDDQINKISPEAIGHAGKLDISSCSQSKKDQLYAKARDAFASQIGTSAYYPLIQPYLGGAPVKDLQHLAGSDVAMDIDTFISLNPSELQRLSVQDVKNLLGINLPDLKQAENHPSVANWTQRHYQSELDRVLGIGLQGGMPEPVPMAAASNGTSTSPDSSTTPPATAYSVTTTDNSTSSPATAYNVTTIDIASLPLITYSVTTASLPFTNDVTSILNSASPPATSYNVTDDTTSPPPTSNNVTDDTTSPPPTSYNVTDDTTSPPATSYNVTDDTTSLLVTSYNVTDDTTSPPATSYNVTVTDDTTSPPPTSYNVTVTDNTTSPPATSYNVTITDDTTSPPATSYVTDDTTSPPPTSYNVTDDTTSPPATSYNVTDDTTSPPATSYNVTDDTTSRLVTSYNVTVTDDTTSPPATSYNVTDDTTSPPPTSYNVTDDTTSPPATSYNVTDDTTSPPATSYNVTDDTTSLLVTSYNVTVTDDTTSPPATSYNVTDDTTSPPPTSYNVTDDTTSPPATSYNVTDDTTSPPATSYNVTDDTTSPPATSYNVTDDTTSPPATSYNVTDDTTSLLVTSYNVTVTDDTTSPPATSYNVTVTDNTTSPPATSYNVTVDTTSPPPTSYNVTDDTISLLVASYNVTDVTTSPTVTSYSITTEDTTSPPATPYNVSGDTTSPPAISYNVTDNTTSLLVTSYNVTPTDDTTSPPATTYNVTPTDDTASPPATIYNVTVPEDTTSPPAIATPLATIHSSTTTHNTSSPTVISVPTDITYNATTPSSTTSPPNATHNTTFITSTKQPATPLQPTPYSTSPIPITSASTPKSDLTPAAGTTVSTSKTSSTSTATAPTSPGKTVVPPAPATTTSFTTPKTETKRTATNMTRPPKPAPAGYIVLEPVTASGSKPSLSLLHTLSITVGLLFVRRFL